MRRIYPAACWALFGYATTVFAQPADAPQVGSAAKELAALLIGKSAITNSNEVTKSVERYLLTTQSAPRGQPCDPKNEACIAAAKSVAKEVAARQESNLQREFINSYAARLQTVMTEQEMKRAADHLKSPTGGALSRGLESLLKPSSEQLQNTMRAISASSGEAMAGALDAFYDRTKDLPRRSAPNLPPSPSLSK